MSDHPHPFVQENERLLALAIDGDLPIVERIDTYLELAQRSYSDPHKSYWHVTAARKLIEEI